MMDEFAARGIELAAVSSNTLELARKSVEKWGLELLPVGYGLPLEDADRWGLFVSSAMNEAEPEHFNEPGIFMIQPGGKLYASIVQTMPFSRPPGSTLLKMLEWVMDNGYPARGEVRPQA